MTPYRNRQTLVTKRMAEDMLVRNLAARTIDSYTYHVDRFAKHFGKLPEDLGPEEVREFQLWMIQVNESSWSQFNQAVCALRFLYSITIPRDWAMPMIPFGKRPKKLPNVLGQDEVHDLIQCVTHPKHRAVLLTLYAAGLRLSEATNLKLPDIDSQRMQLKINHGKGGKDRYMPLSPRLLDELRTYWKIERPTNYLFPGKIPDVPLSGATIQKACKMAAAQARISKTVTPHTLRHSFATGLLEAGVDLMAISKLLGHSSFVTTMVYLHCRKQHLASTPSPLDWLPTRQCPRWVDASAWEMQLSDLSANDWNVFIQPPPKESSDPEQVVKYLARYMTGGPISDRRLIEVRDDRVHFWARALDKSGRNERVSLSGVEFMRCWALHILPKGFTKVRCYGGWSNTGRGGYLARCARLTPPVIETRSDPPPKTEPQTPTANTPSCPKCKTPTVLESSARRPSWRDLFYGPDTIDAPHTIAYVASG